MNPEESKAGSLKREPSSPISSGEEKKNDDSSESSGFKSQSDLDDEAKKTKEEYL